MAGNQWRKRTSKDGAGHQNFMTKLTKAEARKEVKDIESAVCRLSMRLLDDNPVIAKMLIQTGRSLLEIWELLETGV